MIASEITAALVTRGYYVVSEGSCCEAALIPAFLGVLQELAPAVADALVHDSDNAWIVDRPMHDEGFADLDEAERECIDWFLWEDLWSALSKAAPVGCVFGQSPDNPSLFMFTRKELIDADG